MKRFLALSICFLVIFVLVYVLGIRWYNLSNEQVFKLPNDKHIIFLGNSHVETSLNDSIISGAYNFARSSEEIEYAYAKLKLITKYNPQVDCVVFGLDNVISRKTGDSDYDVAACSPRYFEALSLSDILFTIRHRSCDFIFDNTIHLCDIVKLRTHTVKSSMGGYLYLVRDNLENDIKKRGKRKYSTETNEEFLYFLNKIAVFCSSKHIKLIFICPPQYEKTPLSKTLAPRIAHKYFPEVEFYNFIDLKFPENCYGDLDHLNYRGAKAFSEYIEASDLLKK